MAWPDPMTDLSAMAKQVLDQAEKAGRMIATAESCTGGMIFAALTDHAGSSAVMERGFVTYSNAAKSDMLGVPMPLIEDHGAVSEPVAKAMAEGALAASPVDLAIAVTGVAGPGATERKPEGRVCFALAERGRPTLVETVDFGAIGRGNVRAETNRHALQMLNARLSNTAT